MNGTVARRMEQLVHEWNSCKWNSCSIHMCYVNGRVARQMHRTDKYVGA